MTGPELSIVVTVFNMAREAPRTLHSLSTKYQLDVSDDQYEVIVVDNGSSPPLESDAVTSCGSNFRFERLTNATASPAGAMNRGAELAKGRFLGLIVDGARMVTPGMVSSAINVLTSQDAPVVETVSFILGPELLDEKARNGFDQIQEDGLLEAVGWPREGYRLFEISSWAPSSGRGWYGKIKESSCLFLRRDDFLRHGGYEERFVSAGGGLVSHDLYNRLMMDPTLTSFRLIGEASFHQMHGGAATGISKRRRLTKSRRVWEREYKEIPREAPQASRSHASDGGHSRFVRSDSAWAKEDAPSMTRTEDLAATAILILRSGSAETWANACLEAVSRLTESPKVYIARSADTPQRLYEQACADGARFIIALGPGVVPAHRDWLDRLLADLRETDLVATSGAEQIRRKATSLATTVEFLTSESIEFTGEEPLGSIVDRVEAIGGRLQILEPTNRNQLSNFPGRLYGDILYDHGTELWSRALEQPRGYLTDAHYSLASRLALQHTDSFYEWLRGSDASRSIFFVLGMHRSGTSLLTACLEQCGLFLGKTLNSPLPDQPRGNFERLDAMAINKQILADENASWNNPPDEVIREAPKHLEAISALVAELERNAPSGLKDPRMLLCSNPWLEVVDHAAFVGTFRHPEAVARSLWDRDRMSPEDAYGLWTTYNEQLVQMHKTIGFPLIEFDLSDRATYARRVAAVAVSLGLQPKYHKIMATVEDPIPRKKTKPSVAVARRSAEIYEYLRQHQFLELRDEQGLAALLLEWEVTQIRGDEPQVRRSIERRIWTTGQRMPRRLRVYLWRFWRSLRGRFGKQASP